MSQIRKSADGRLWAQIPGYDHWVSDKGDVMNMRTRHPMKIVDNGRGVMVAKIRRNGEPARPMTVARLVLEAFSDGDDDYCQGEDVWHIDLNPKNNEFENLRWAPRADSTFRGMLEKWGISDIFDPVYFQNDVMALTNEWYFEPNIFEAAYIIGVKAQDAYKALKQGLGVLGGDTIYWTVQFEKP